MYAFFQRLVSWIIRRLVVTAVLGAIAVAVVASWICRHDQVGFVRDQHDQRAAIAERREALQARQLEVEQKLTNLQEELGAQQRRVEQAAALIAQLQGQRSWWKRWFGDREQQATNEARIKKLEALKAEAAAKIPVIQRLQTDNQWEHESNAVELDRNRGESDDLASEEGSLVRHYLRQAWARSKWYVTVGMVLYFCAPLLLALVFFYGLAAWIARGRPVVFDERQAEAPRVGESGAAIELPVWPGEIAWVRPSHLRAADATLARGTRRVMNWWIPIGSWAAGLTGLAELRHASVEGEGRLTIGAEADADERMVVIEVPEDAGLVARARSVVGVVRPGAGPLRIRRHWRVLRWLPWITGQFRFLEFRGPCRLVVAGVGGVETEQLVAIEGEPAPLARTVPRRTPAFAPTLKYGVVRTASFWDYLVGRRRLFDGLLDGGGLVVRQTGRRKRGWTGAAWDELLRLFGL